MAVKSLSAALLAIGLVAAGGVQAGLSGDLVNGQGSVCFGDCSTPDGELFSFGVLIDQRTGDIYTNGPNRFVSAQGDIATVGMIGNIDPIMVGAFTVVDNGAPTSFGLSVTSPFAPAEPAGAMLTSVATLTGVLTDPQGGTVSVTPNLVSPLLMEALVQGTSVVAVGPGVADAASSHTYGPESATATTTCPAGGCDNFGFLLSFIGDGGGAQYAFTATHLLTPAQDVAIPAPLLLIGLGLLGMSRNRRTASAR